MAHPPHPSEGRTQQSQPGPPAQQGRPAPRPVQAYDERLTAPRSWWAMAFMVGVVAALTLLPFGTLPMLAGLVAGAAVSAVLVSSYGSARIRVVADSLVAGDARIPLSALGTAHPLDEEEARAWRSYKADPRAHMVLRGYVKTAVRVENTDPADPVPYIYLSTRAPEQLAAALGTTAASGDPGNARDNAQGSD